MRTKDQLLLEKIYSNVLLENENKFQPNDPEMQELSKVDMREEFPEEENSNDKEESLSQEQMVEAQALADYIEKNINSINPDMNYKTFANAIKIILKDFGSHNIPAFVEEILK
jgi:hypothetical protein